MIHLVLFEDNTLLRDALAAMIEDTDDFVLRGAFPNAMTAEADVARLRPDVVLMDIDLPGRNGIDAVRALRASQPQVDVLMLTVFDDDERVFNAIRAGATGYLLKKTPPQRIVEAIREVYEGGAPMSPGIARRVMATMQQPANPQLASLTARETEVLTSLSQGNSYKLVAAELGMSVETVRTHVKRIYEKLHVHSVTEAVARLR